MPVPRPLTELERQKLQADALREFPDDDMMREVHFVRLLHQAQMEGLTSRERVEYLNRLLPSSTDHE